MNLSLFSGSGTLLRFTLRRDRIRLPLSVGALSAFAIVFVPVFAQILADSNGIDALAAMMENPAMVAIVGPVFGITDYHTGAMYANMMLLFSVMIAGGLNIFLISRHTRQDEELGRLEVVRSLPVGRMANLLAAMLNAVITNTLLALLSSIGMYLLRADGMDLNGCLLYGAAMGVIGLFFAAATALFAQLSANNRIISAISLLLLLVLYMMRAIGDLGNEILALISPLGLILRTKVFVDNSWLPIWIILLITFLLTAVAFALSGIRDLGQGLVSERPGPRHAVRSLSGPLGLASRLLRSSFIIWGIVIFVFAAMYGSVFGDMESFIQSNAMVQMIFGGNGSTTLVAQFIVKLIAIMAMITAIPIISFAGRIVTEEKNGYSEHLWGKSVSRHEQMAAYLSLAFVMSIIFQLLCALGFWSVGKMVLDTIPTLGTFTAAALAYLPAIWMLMSITAVLAAYLPGKTFIVYLYLGYSFISIYFGDISGFPKWASNLTPFGLIPQYPVEEMTYTALIIITLISALLVLAGFLGYRRRDMRLQ